MIDNAAEPEALAETVAETLTFTFRQPWSMVGWNALWGIFFTILLLIPTGLIVFWFNPGLTASFVSLGLLVFLAWCALDTIGFAIAGSALCWTLRIDGRTIVRTYGKFWVRTDTIPFDGTVFQPIRLAAPQRFLFPEGFYSAYQVEMLRSEETLLFPCRDEEELREWFERIETFQG